MFTFIHRNLNSDSPIQWQIGSKIVIPDLINQQSMGRIYVSVMDKININKVKLIDSNIYRYVKYVSRLYYSAA